MAVWVSCGDAFAEGLQAAHLRLDPAADMVSGSPLPGHPAIVPCSTQGFVSSDCGRAILFPRTTVLADRDDRCGLAVDDGGMAAAGVIGAVGGYRADVFALGDLVQQVRQDRTVAVTAGGELHRPNVRRGGIHGQMHLAPLTPALNAVLAGLPFAITEELDAGAVHQQIQGAISAPIRDLDGQRFLPSAQGGVVGHRPIQVRHLEQAGHHPGRLPKRQLEQDLDGQTKLDRRIREHRRATGAAVMRREPDHLLVQPDKQRPALAQRR